MNRAKNEVRDGVDVAAHSVRAALQARASWIKGAILGIVAAAAVALIGILAVLFGGLYDVAATREHFRPVYWALAEGLKRSVVAHANGIVPPSFDRSSRMRGLLEYDEHCVKCHGAPGVAPDAFALGLEPIPENLVYAANELRPREVFWILRHGIKMTGMPAWYYRLPEKQLWDITAFVMTLPELSPVEYKKLLSEAKSRRDELLAPPVPTSPLLSKAAPASSGEGRKAESLVSESLSSESLGRQSRTREQTSEQTREATQYSPEALGRMVAALGDPKRGREAIPQYGCTTCHMIPGVMGRKVHVGPPLRGIAVRSFVAGELPNTPANLMRWLLETHKVEPQSAMPNLGLKPRDAADIAAYLYTLRAR